MNKKKLKKRSDKKCHFCDEADYSLLDCHRMIPGSKGGKYTEFNMVTCCANCHRKCHSGRIKIIGKYPSTSGEYVINYIEDDEEKWA